jgi:hypothetical protein
MSKSSAFARLKKKRTNVSELASKLESASGKKSYGDDRFWKLHKEQSGIGSAVIRLLPASEGNDTPFIKKYSHGFQGPGGWYIDVCPTTIGQECPVCDHNKGVVEKGGGWEDLDEPGKKYVREHKRREEYNFNILVLKDDHNPDNEGKNFLWSCGKSVFDIIISAMDPEFDDEDPLNPFDMWEGADLKLKSRKADGYIKYDRSGFESPTALFDGDDEKLEELYGKQYDLNEFVDPNNFKDYAFYESKLNTALGTKKPKRTVTEDSGDDSPAPKPVKSEKASKTTDAPSTSTDDGDDEEMMAYFSAMAES